jgi:hypothetical protein
LSDETLISITLYGEIKENRKKWINWYEDAKKIVKSLGYEPNYFSVESSALKFGEVMELEKNEKKLLKAIEAEDKIEWIAVYSLPLDYSSASFDYDVLLARTNEYVTFITNISDFNKINEEFLVSSLKKYILCKEGEIYEMDRDESPLIYASKANPPSSFSTLKVIKKLS